MVASSQNNLYGFPQPLSRVFPAPIVAQRAPTTSDIAYPPGQVWDDQAGGNIYFLVEVVGGSAVWELAAGANAYPITPYVVGPNGGYSTIQSAIDAANAAGGGLVFIQPGTYTENLIFADNVPISGASEQSTFIIGTHTPNATGTLNIFRLTLQSATHIFSSVAAGSTTIIIEDCSFNVTNGYTFNLLNWTGAIAVYDIGSSGTNDGVINNTGGATCFFISGSLGAGTGQTMITSGPVILEEIDLNCPWSAATGSNIQVTYTKFTRAVTAANNSTGTFSNCFFNSGAVAALTMSSSGAISLSKCIVTSSNSPAIAGAGAGVLTLADVTLTSNTAIAGTLTLGTADLTRGSAFLASSSAGGYSALVGTNTAGASPQVVSARHGQAAFTDVINAGAYGTLTVTNTLVAGTSHIMATASCTTANSACVVVDVVPGAGSFACRVFNAGAANTAADILITFWVLD